MISLAVHPLTLWLPSLLPSLILVLVQSLCIVLFSSSKREICGDSRPDVWQKVCLQSDSEVVFCFNCAQLAFVQ